MSNTIPFPLHFLYIYLYEHRGFRLFGTLQYWDGDLVPPYVKLSMLTVRAQNPYAKLFMLNDTSFKFLVDDVHEAYDYLIPVHKADYLRCRLLEQYGGLWIDADTYCKIDVRFE